MTKPNFIDFALSLYAQPAVEAECLQLQDNHDVSVPLLLCCAWLDFGGVGATLESIGVLAKDVLVWEQTVVWPLRQLRRQLKCEAESSAAVAEIRAKIKQAELAAELEVLQRLGAIAWPSCSEPALTSLRLYYQLAGDCDSFGALRARMAVLKADALTGQTN
ncbi:TIGR02444 family protein [Simiduia curdlanivorans]|uniref:TIGR02444 family protein n=1 Tax=Simiduia curdlanivorans TaxID=1492769 RepID=A0ABV8V013_9GAMM|nr:TIGR02444 family protein [Simiduia curdlanivorans]MDN3637901.1 TIGR02444 family protein [Simiduia curdlanivorans]